MTNWRAARAITQLLAEIDAAYPKKQRGSSYVGIVGDASHQASASDHNPNRYGVVCALDVGFKDEKLDDQLVAALVATRDPRIGYIISDRKMWRSYAKPGIKPWTAAPYSGSNPHTTHVHISLVQDPNRYDDPRPFGIAKKPATPAAPAKTAPRPPRPRPPATWTFASRRYYGPGDMPGTGKGCLLWHWQQRMANRGWKIGVDGYYGPQTKSVATAFQREKSLTVDGLVGRETYYAAWTAPLT